MFMFNTKEWNKKFAVNISRPYMFLWLRLGMHTYWIFDRFNNYLDLEADSDIKTDKIDIFHIFLHDSKNKRQTHTLRNSLFYINLSN